MSKQVVEDLRAARALIERGWCRVFDARDERGIRVGALSAQAVMFCINGACCAVTRARQVPGPLVKALCGQLPNGYTSLPLFNDRSRSPKRILALFDAAIAAEEAAP